MNRWLLFLGLVSASYSCGEAEAESLAANEGCSIYHDVHLILIDSLSAADRVMVLEELASLSAVSGVSGFSLSERAETNDPRALKEVDVSLRMCFSDTVAMNNYRIDPDHLQVKKNIAAFLKVAPTVIDSRVIE
jgi:hypothetical protein